jgi:uncharacterized protein YndB with AHSA1/START domain
VTGIYRSFAYRIDIAAPTERVWRAFTDGAALERWSVAGATIQPRENGKLLAPFGDLVTVDAHIDVFQPSQRMRLLHMPTRGMPPTESVVVEDFLFEREKQGTVVRLLSSGVPSSQAWVTYYLNKRRYWELALTRLKVFLEKGLDGSAPPKPEYLRY